MMRCIPALVLLPVALALDACGAPWRGPPDWDSIFVKDRMVTWRLEVAGEDWLSLIVDPRTLPDCAPDQFVPGCIRDDGCPCGCRPLEGACRIRYVPADVEVDGVLYPRAGLRLLGDRDKPKKTLRVRFDEFTPGQTFRGVKRLNLRPNGGDPSLVREALALRLFLRAGVPAPRSSFVWVDIGGVPAGIYTLVQQVDRKFIEERFGEDRGNLWCIERGGNLVYGGEEEADYDFLPPYQESDPPLTFARRYELKTNEHVRDISDLIGLMRVLDQAPDDELGDALDEVLDTDRFLRLLAVNSWLANMDSYPGTADNLYLYHDAFGRFRPLPWDLNRAFGNYHNISCDPARDLSALDPFAPTCGGPRPLVDRVLADARLRRVYRRHLGELVDGALHPEAVEALAASLRARIQQAVEDDPTYRRAWLEGDFDASYNRDVRDHDRHAWVPGLVPFIRARDEAVRARLGSD